jgi:LysR family transcriptional regulator, cell division regulator
MDADDFRIFEAVIKNGSMNRAAAELNMVQSNVTARIRLLEEELGVQLFIRHSRGVEPSEAGLRLLSYAKQIGSLMQEARTAVKEDGIPRGRLRIGTTETTVGLRLPRFAAEYARKFPQVELSITTGATTPLIHQVLDRQLDGAFVSGPVGHEKLSEEPILDEQLVLVSPTSLQHLSDLANVKDLKIIVFQKDCSYRQRLDSFLGEMGVKYHVMEFSSLDAISTCISAGVGITLLPAALVDHVWKDGDVWKDRSVAVHQLPADKTWVQVVFVQRSDSYPTSALNSFLKMCREIPNGEPAATP